MKLMFNEKDHPGRALYKYWDMVLKGANTESMNWGTSRWHGGSIQRDKSPKNGGPVIAYSAGFWLRPNGDFSYYQPHADHGRNRLRDHTFLDWGYAASRVQWFVNLNESHYYGGTDLNHLTPGDISSVAPSGEVYYWPQLGTTSSYWGGRRWLRLQRHSIYGWAVTAAPQRGKIADAPEWNQPKVTQNALAMTLAEGDRLRKRRYRLLRSRALVSEGGPRFKESYKINGIPSPREEAGGLIAVHFDLLQPAKQTIITQEAQEAH